MNHEKAEGAQTPGKQIVLQSFSQRLGAWPDDDWSGITDPKQRRKLQNRLNQRARRKSDCDKPVYKVDMLFIAFGSTCRTTEPRAADMHNRRRKE